MSKRQNLPYRPAPWHGVIVGYARRRMLRVRWQQWRGVVLLLLTAALLMGTAVGLAYLMTALIWGDL
ncbi:hypothetical protein AAHN93_14555 [Vandammella animalimorsus]|uniref:hypothetical protein n=1 Tax=Vandammella animalimorsus TaxID=2029117 RepID=UPI000BAA5DE6|nr:hypothetical protein [Vandammella animalimorsus]